MVANKHNLGVQELELKDNNYQSINIWNHCSADALKVATIQCGI